MLYDSKGAPLRSLPSYLMPNRRDVFRTAGAALLTGVPLAHQPVWAQASCALMGSPSLTEGPYFVDADLNRNDIRADPFDDAVSQGVPLSLAINVSQLVNCQLQPLTGAYVDIWQCDARGVYSGVAAQDTVGRKFLRGYQPTDRYGNVYFLTVYPGWYPGRAVHIHIKVRVFNGLNETYEFTSQFFFDERFTDAVYDSSAVYRRTGQRTTNQTDGIFRGGSLTGTLNANAGSFLMLSLRNRTRWVEADARLVCDLSLGSSPDGTPGGGPGGPPPGGPGGPPPGGPGGPPPRP
ncbi:MAG: twin-arginine translocation pathway signal protein [Acidobacteria bacterium]|nr:twin-arginine translocation pathway signal protein [Acidobacteriota bacterium]